MAITGGEVLIDAAVSDSAFAAAASTVSAGAAAAAGGAAGLAVATEGGDAISTLLTAADVTGAETATGAAAAYGYGTPEALLGAVNPGYVTAGTGVLSSIANSKVGQTVLGSVAGNVAGSLLAGKPRVGSPQTTLGPTPVMPLPDDQAVIAARRKSLAAQSLNQGRASTILGGSGDSSQKLGN